MDRRCFIKSKTKWLFVCFLLVSAVQSGVRGMYCPSNCVCKFNNILEDNMALCTFGNARVNISWCKSYEDVMLELNCQDEIENNQYDCNKLSQFNISSNEAALMVKGCAPSIMKCAHNIFKPVTTITILIGKNIAGSFTANYLNNFDQVYRAKMYLNNGGTEMQADALNALKSLKYFIMKGGNLKLSTNALKLSKLENLELDRNSIQYMPPNAFINLPKLRFIDIRRNNFEYLGANAFRGLDSLENLYVFNNTLVTVDPTAFSTMKQLRHLNIVYNKLKLIPNGLFDGLDKLNQIKISKNQVELTLDTHAFANLPDSVKLVALPNSNIKYLPEYVFDGSANIEQLVLQENEIESLPPKIFATTMGLIEVDLSTNKIQSLPDGIFSELKQLETIDFSHNHLSVLRG